AGAIRPCDHAPPGNPAKVSPRLQGSESDGDCPHLVRKAGRREQSLSGSPQVESQVLSGLEEPGVERAGDEASGRGESSFRTGPEVCTWGHVGSSFARRDPLREARI